MLRIAPWNHIVIVVPVENADDHLKLGKVFAVLP
jgi:hypothetical protein